MAAEPEPRLSKLQQQRSRETREKLIEAANRLWREHGFDETTVNEVCDEAGVSKGTFYFYFLRKEDLLLELAAATSERVWNDWQRALEGDDATAELARTMIQTIARRTSRTPRNLLARTVTELLASAGQRWQTLRGERNDFGALFRSLYARAQDRREMASDHTPADLAGMTTVVLLQGMLMWAWGAEESLDNILWRRMAIILRGAGVSGVD